MTGLHSTSDRRRTPTPIGDLTSSRIRERNDFLWELNHVLGGTWEHPIGPIIIDGAPGTGKTAMFNACACIADRLGVRVLRARCAQAELTAEFGIARQVLAPILRQVSTNAVSVPDRAGLALRVMTTGPTDDDDLNDIFQSLGALLHVASCGPTAVIIDDVHWADQSTSAWLQFLARRVDSSLHLILTSRPRYAGVALRATDRLLSDPATRHMALRPLTQGATGAMLAERVGSPLDDASSAAAHLATGGSPALIVALVREIDDRQAATSLSAGFFESLSSPLLAHSIRARLSPLGDGAQELLEAVAVLGPSADMRVAAAIAGIDGDEAGSIADGLANISILRPGRPLEFLHPFVQRSVYHEIPSTRRSRWHSHAAELLTALGKDIREVSFHVLRTDSGENAWTVEVLVEAAIARLDGGELMEATHVLQRADNEMMPTHLRARVANLRAQVDGQLGLASSIAHLTRASNLGLDVSEWVTTALGLLDDQWTRSAALTILDIVRPVEDLLADRPDLLVRVQLADAVLSAGAGGTGSCIGSTSAAEVADAIDPDPDAVDARLLRVHRLLTCATRHPYGTAQEVVDALQLELDPEVVQTGGPVRTAVLVKAFATLIRAGANDVVDPLIRAAKRAADTDGRVTDGHIHTLMLGLSLSLQGRLRSAEELLRMELRCQPDERLGACLTLMLAWVLAQRGALDSHDIDIDIDVDIGAIASLTAVGPQFLVMAAELDAQLRLEAGDWTAAWATYGRLADESDHLPLSQQLATWHVGRCVALQALGRHSEARVAAKERLVLAQRYGARVLIAEALVGVARTAPIDTQANTLDEAIGYLDGTSAQLFRCAVLVELGAAWRRRGETTRARSVLREAADLAMRIGATRLANASARELMAAGARPRRLQMSGVDALTPAELRVALLAAQGDTNSVIAASLYINAKTVESHLAHTFKKLGIAHRSQLAGMLDNGAEPSVGQNAS